MRIKKAQEHFVPGLSLINSVSPRVRSAGAAADRGVAEADGAAAAVVAASLAAFAAGLEQFAALLVAAGASDLHTVLRIFAVGMANSEIALANGDAVVSA